MITDVLVA